LNKKKFRNLAVICSGLIGTGIAHVSIDKGFNVILRKALSLGFAQMTKDYPGYVKRTRLTK
jgi:enoyl-CoA hydratase/long-chain 3-hydroxyacyl-CoA dehydrogenase